MSQEINTTVLMHDTKVAEVPDDDQTKAEEIQQHQNLGNEVETRVMDDKKVSEIQDPHLLGNEVQDDQNKAQEVQKEKIRLGNEIENGQEVIDKGINGNEVSDDKAEEVKKVLLGDEIKDPVRERGINGNDISEETMLGDEIVERGLNGDEVSDLKAQEVKKIKDKANAVDDDKANEVSDPDVLKLNIVRNTKTLVAETTEDSPDHLHLSIRTNKKTSIAEANQDPDTISIQMKQKTVISEKPSESDTLHLNLQTKTVVKTQDKISEPDTLHLNLQTKTTTTTTEKMPETDTLNFTVKQNTTITPKQQDLLQIHSQSFVTPTKEKKSEPFDFTASQDQKPLPKSMSMLDKPKDEPGNDFYAENPGNLKVKSNKKMPSLTLESAHILVKDQPVPISIGTSAILVKLKKRWTYKLEIRFYVNEDIDAGCMVVENISTLTSSTKHASKLGKLVKRDERYVITLPERNVLFSIFSKTSVKVTVQDPKGRVLILIQFAYDCK